MCGIAGVLHAGTARVDGTRLSRLSQALAHRGPDDLGFLGWSPGESALVTRDPHHVDGSVCAFVHRRLSILDTSTSGWQPMQTENGRQSIVFNGEIYNYLELRAELEREGARFRSGSDTEVLLEAYARWGKRVLRRCVGMFAFAILDLDRDCLFLARDPFGIKPLYYSRSDISFAFASEAIALLDIPGVSRQVRAEGLYDYLRFGITDAGDRTLWRDIQQLPAAHYLEVPLGDQPVTAPCRYWSLPQMTPLDVEFGVARDHLRNLFLDSINLHLRSDVPVGSCLSGGIDSSAIVMAMRRALGTGAPLHTFSYVASDPRLSEERWMKLVAEAACANAQYARPTEQDLVASLPDLIRTQGEPFGSTSIFAQYAVFRLAAEHGISVMLDGQGADEMLGGYWSAVAARIASMTAEGELFGAARLFRRGASFPDITAGKLASMSAGILAPSYLQELGRKAIGRSLTPPWLNVRWFRERGARISSPWRRAHGHQLREQLRQSVEEVSLPMLLRYEDRNSMRFSIESRVPFLTPQIAEFIFSLPERYLVDDFGERKSVFRAAMRGIVPDAVLDRRDKIGFQTSESQWLRRLAPWIRDLLGSDVARTIPALDLAAVTDEYEDFVAERRPLGAHAWRWVNLIQWTDQFNVTFDS